MSSVSLSPQSERTHILHCDGRIAWKTKMVTEYQHVLLVLVEKYFGVGHMKKTMR